jgi:enamine deaminase RidA (YjgF/YER057c/UK114 family)
MGIELLRRPAGMAEPLGRYSQICIVRDQDIAFIAGQVGILESGELAGDGSFAAQVKQTFHNIGVALGAIGASFADVVKTSTFIVAGQPIEEFMKARTEVFEQIYPSAQYPPNTILVVNRLVEERLLIEIEATVAVGRSH